MRARLGITLVALAGLLAPSGRRRRGIGAGVFQSKEEARHAHLHDPGSVHE
jgi:heme exporter protein D